MTKLLWHSNAPFAPTGYGQQTGIFLPLLAKHYDVAASAFYGLEGASILWKGIPIFPGIGGAFDEQYLPQRAAQFFGGDPREGIVLTLLDVWVLNHRFMNEINVAAWTPVDHEPAPPKVLEFFAGTGAVPIAMTRNGQEMLADFNPLYVPHGIDTTAYQPHDRDAVREQVGVPKDVFLVGMVAANKGRPSRKSFSEAFQAFARFAEKREDARLYLHTTMNPAYANGEDLAGLLEALGVPEDRVLIADQYRMLFDPYSQPVMGKIYSTFDVLLNPAKGEGFGIPVLEAQACGVPAIVTDFTAMREVCGAGWHVKHTPYWSGLGSWQATPDVDDIVAALEECYTMPQAQRERLSQRARKHAMQYTASRVLGEHFLPALRECERRLMPSVEVMAA